MCAKNSDHIYNMVCPVTGGKGGMVTNDVQESFIGRLKEGLTTTRTLVDKLVLSLMPCKEDFSFSYLPKLNSFLDNNFNLDREDTVNIMSAYGYNTGLVIPIVGDKEKVGSIAMKWFDPEKSDKDDDDYFGGKEGNFRRQGVQLQLGGDVLQYLRAKDAFKDFIQLIDNNFRVKCTQIDVTLDVFNADKPLTPRHFFDIYREGKYSGRARLNVTGDAQCPTVYIGQFRSNGCIMLYDKLLENKDTGKHDEPEIFEACSSWFRTEIHYTRDHNSADDVFKHLLRNADNLSESVGQVVSKGLRSKCRFLKDPRDTNSNVGRIETDDLWQYLLDLNDEAKFEFTSHRPELDLDDRKKNFKYRSIGGAKLLNEILEKEHEDGLFDFLNDALGVNIFSRYRM